MVESVDIEVKFDDKYRFNDLTDEEKNKLLIEKDKKNTQ